MRNLRFFLFRHAAFSFVAPILGILLIGPLQLTASRGPRRTSAEKPVVPTVNAEVGACSAVFTVTDARQKPIYNAKIDLTFRYGFMRLHKVTLEVYTNTDGKGRFAGLPDQVRNALVFQFQFGDRQTTVTDDPGVTCQLTKTVVLP